MADNTTFENKRFSESMDNIDKTTVRIGSSMDRLDKFMDRYDNATTTTDKNGNVLVTVNVTENRNLNVTATAKTDDSVKETTEEVKELGEAAEEASKKLGEFNDTAKQTGDSTAVATREVETTEQALTRMNDAVDKFNKRGTPFASIKSWYAPLSDVRAAIDKVTEGVDLTAKSLDGIGKDKQRQIWNLGASFQVLGGNLSEVSEDMAAFWSMLDENKGTLGINIKMDNMKEAFGLLKEIEEKAGSLEGLGLVKNLGKNVSDITSKIKVKIDVGEAVSFEGTEKLAEKLAEKLTKEVEKASDELDKAIVTAMRKTSDRKVLDFTKSKYGFYEYIDESDNNKKKRKPIDFESMSELPDLKTINGYFKMLKSSVDKYGLNMKFEFFTDADEVSKDIISVTEYLNALNESIRNYNELNEGPGSKKLKEFSVRDLITTEDKSVTNKDGVINPDMRDKEVRELKKYLNETTTSLSQTKRKIQDMKFDEALNLFVGRETKDKSGEIAERAKEDAKTYFEELRKAFQEKDINKLMESFQLKDASGKKNKNVKILEDITGKSLTDQESIDKVIRRVNPTEFDRLADTKALRQRLIRNYDIKGTPPEIKELIDSLIEDIDGTVKSYIEASQKLQSKAEELGYIYQEFKGKKKKKNNNSEEQSVDNEEEEEESYNFAWKKVKQSRDKGKETFADISVEKLEKPVEKAKEAEKTIENIVSEIAKTEIKIPEIDTSNISIAKDELVALLADYKKLKDEGNTAELEKQGEKIKEFVDEEKENISYFLDINKGEKAFDFDLFKEMDDIFGGDVLKALNDLDDVSLQNINEQLDIYYNRCKGVIATNDKLEETLQAFSNTKMNSDDVEKYWREITGLLKGVQNIDINSMERVYVLLSNIRGYFQEGPELFKNINDVGKIAETLVNVGLSDVKSVFGTRRVSGSVQSSLKGVLGITSGSEEEKAFQSIISSINSKEITHLMEALQKISILYAQIQNKAKETKDDVENLQNVNTDTASKEKSNINQMENVSENLGKSAEELKETAEQVNEAAEKLEEAKNGKEGTSNKPEKEKSKETVDLKLTIRQNSVTGNVTVTSSMTSRSESKVDNPQPQPVVPQPTPQPQPTAQPTSNTVATLKASKAAVEEGMNEINEEMEKGAEGIEEKKQKIIQIFEDLGKTFDTIGIKLKLNLDIMENSDIEKLYKIIDILDNIEPRGRMHLFNQFEDPRKFVTSAITEAKAYKSTEKYIPEADSRIADIKNAVAERIGINPNDSKFNDIFDLASQTGIKGMSRTYAVKKIMELSESLKQTTQAAEETKEKLDEVTNSGGQATSVGTKATSEVGDAVVNEVVETNAELDEASKELEEKKNKINEILAEIGKGDESFFKFNLDIMDDAEIEKLYNVLELLKDYDHGLRDVLISDFQVPKTFVNLAVLDAKNYQVHGKTDKVDFMEKAISTRLGIPSELTELFHEVFSQALDIPGNPSKGMEVIMQYYESISTAAELATESLGKLANAEQEVVTNVQPTTTEAEPIALTSVDENLEETAEKVETAKDKIVKLLNEYKQETDDSNLRNIADQIIDAFSFEGLDDKGILKLENIINNLRNLPVDEVYDILSKYQNMDEFIPAIAKSMYSQTDKDTYTDTVFAMMEGIGAGTSTDIKIRKKFSEINGMEFGNISNLFTNMENLRSMSLDKVIDQIQKLYEKLKDAAELAYKTKTNVEEVNQEVEQSSNTTTQQNNPRYASRENMKAFIRGYSLVDLENSTATLEHAKNIISGTGGRDTLTDELYTRLSYVLQHISELNFDEVVNLVMTLRDGEKYIDQFAEDYKMLSTSPFEANVKEAENLKNVFFGMMKEVGGTEDISLINKILEGSQSLDEVKQKLRELYKEAIEASHAAVEAKNLELEKARQKQEKQQEKQGEKKGRSKKAEPKQEPEQKAEDTAEQTQEQEKQADAVQATEEKFKKLNDAIEKCRDLMKQAQENGKEFFSLYLEKGRYFEELINTIQELDNAELQKFSGRSGNLQKNILGQIDRINTVLSDDYDKDDYEAQTESGFTTILELLNKTIQKEEEQEQQSNDTTEAQVNNAKRVKMSVEELLDVYNKLIEAYKQTQDFDVLVKGLNTIPNDSLRTLASTELGISNPRKNYNSKAGLVAASADVIRQRYGNATAGTVTPEPEPEKPITSVDTDAVNSKYGVLNTTIKEINTGLEELSQKLKNLEQELQAKGADTSFLRKLVDMLDQTIPNAINVKNKRFEGELGVVLEVVEKELAELKKLVDYLSQDIPNAIGVKNEAFRGEESEVDRIVDAEISKFGELTGVTKLDFTDAFNSLNEFLQNIANALQANTLDEFVKQLDKLVFSLEKFDKIKIINSGFFTAIDAMLSKKDELQNLATILAESEKKIEEAAEKVTGKAKKSPAMIGKEMQIFDYDSAEWDSFLKTAEKAEIKLKNIAAVYRQLRKDEKTGNIYESFRVVDDKGNSSTIGADTTGVLARKDVSYNIATLSKEYDKLIKKMSTAKDMEGLNKIKLQISEIDKAMEEATKKAQLGLDTLQKLRDEYVKVNADSVLKLKTNENRDKILETATANLEKLKQARSEYNNELAAAIASGLSEDEINASVASSLQEVEKAERKVADSMQKVNELYKNGAIEKKQYDEINKASNSDDVTKGSKDSLKNVSDARKEQQKLNEDFYNSQRKAAELFQKEQQKYDNELWNEELVQRKKQAYEEINDVLRKYEDILNRVLQGEQIAGYERQLEELKNKIYEMLLAVEKSSNYDGNLERDIMKQLVDSETNFGKAIDKDYADRQREAYAKLTQAVKDYIAVSKKLARAGDKYEPSDVQKLLDAANVILNMRPVDGEDIFDIGLDQKAMKGYDTLTEDLNKINEELNKKGQKELENRWKAAQNAANAYYNAAKRVKELQDAIDLGEKKGGLTQLDSARRRLERTRIKANDAYQNAGQSFGTGELADIGRKDFDNANAIYDTYNGNFDANANSYKNAEGWYNRLINSALKYYSILYKQDAKKSVTYNELQYFKELEKLYKRFYDERAEFDKAENIDPAKRADLSDKLDKATTDARKYMPEMELANINSALDKMGESGGNNLLRDRIEDLRNEYERLGNEINDTSIDWSAQDEKTKERIRTIISEVASLAKETEEASKNPLLADVDPKAVAQFQRQAAEWKANNTAAKEAGEEINNLIDSSKLVQTVGELDGLKVRLENVKTASYEAGVAGKSFGDKLKGSLGNLSRYLMSFASFYNIIGALRLGVQIVKELDTEMTNLKKVVDDTDRSFDNFLMLAFDVAAQLGTTAKSVIQASTEFGRLGYNLQDSLELGKASVIYANVGELDTTTATKDLVATLKAFQKDTSEAMNVVNVLNEIGM